MPCYDNYIGIDPSTPSRSGLYAVNLPGMELAMFDMLTREDQIDYLELWETVYNRAWQNFISDLTDAMQSKFYVDSKLVSRETSQFTDSLNLATGLAGVTIEFALPRYARLHIVSADVITETGYASPEFELQVRKDSADGELLYSVTDELGPGRDSVFIDQDFEVEKMFVGYDADIYALRSTENRRYNNLYSPYYYFNCNSCEFDCNGYKGKIEQINGGGLNVRYNVVCSIEKFACENINLFKQAIFYRVGLELVYERIFGNRLNKYMTMTLERKDEFLLFYDKEYTKNLMQAVKSQNMKEDTHCFSCKDVLSSRSQTP